LVKVTQSGCSLSSFALSRVPFLYIGQRGAGVSAEQLSRFFQAQADRTLGWLRYQPHVRVTEVDYNLLLREPDAQAQQIGLFLGPQVNARECRLVAMGRHPATMPSTTAVRRTPAVRAAYVGFPAVSAASP
jgi:hypothetical protein